MTAAWSEAAALIHVRGEIVKALRAGADRSELDALLLAEDTARQAWERATLRALTLHAVDAVGGELPALAPVRPVPDARATVRSLPRADSIDSAYWEGRDL